MKANFDAALAYVLAHEGGFVNHPSEPGGATNKGVTLYTFRFHFGANRDVDDLKKITPEQLHYIYMVGYWNVCRCSELPSGVDYMVFDQAVHSGPQRSVKWLQSSLEHVTVDGKVGPKTLAAVAKVDPAILISGMYTWRLSYLQGLSTWNVFGKGWQSRINDVRDNALTLLARKQS